MSSDPVAYTEEELQALQTIQLALIAIRDGETFAEKLLSALPDSVPLTAEEIDKVKSVNCELKTIKGIKKELLKQKINIKANPWRRRLCEEVAKRENAGMKWK